MKENINILLFLVAIGFRYANAAPQEVSVELTWQGCPKVLGKGIYNSSSIDSGVEIKKITTLEVNISSCIKSDSEGEAKVGCTAADFKKINIPIERYIVAVEFNKKLNGNDDYIETFWAQHFLQITPTDTVLKYKKIERIQKTTSVDIENLEPEREPIAGPSSVSGIPKPISQ